MIVPQIPLEEQEQEEQPNLQSDCISELPDEVADLIMSRVSLRDRVKATVVSRKWNKMCLSPSEILLSWRSGLVKGINYDGDEDLCPVYQDVFVNNVNQFLASFRGNHVRSFYLRFCLTGSSKHDIDGWIRFALRMGVQSMGLVLYCRRGFDLRSHDVNDPELSFEDVQYVIGTELFDTPRCNLKTLQLTGCNLGPDFAKHLSGLKILNLSFSLLAEYDLQTMLFGLPKLVELLFFRCTLPLELSLSCLSSLKRLKLTHCHGVKRVYLSNVNLVHFSLYAEGAVKCNLVGAPKLCTLGYSATKLTMPYVFKRIPQDAPMLTNVFMSYYGESDDCIPNSLKVFSGVTRLEWKFKQNSRLGIVKMVSILKAFPLLRVLLVSIDNAENLEENNQLTHVNYKPKHLSSVTLRGFYGASGQNDFVVYLLKHATMLEQLIITSHKSWGEGPRQDFFSKLEGFRKDVKVIVS